MRKLIIVLPALLVVGCAATGGQQYAKVHDRKNNTYSYVAVPTERAFVGTAATQDSRRPSWWMHGHP